MQPHRDEISKNLLYANGHCPTITLYAFTQIYMPLKPGLAIATQSQHIGTIDLQRRIHNDASTMPPLSTDCWNNDLTGVQLDIYIQNDPYKDIPSRSILNQPGPPEDLTPLGAACARGHIDIVRLLLEKGADVNRGCPHGRTPLWHATATCPPQNRLAIVQELLQAPSFSSLNVPSTDSLGNTPLMNAIKTTRDKEVARLLVDQGADLKIKNAKEKSALSMAKGTEFESVLKGSSGLLATLAAVIFRVVALIMYVIAWVNEKQKIIRNGVKEGVVKAYYWLTGRNDPAPNPDEKKAQEDVAVGHQLQQPRDVSKFGAYSSL